MNEKIQSIGHYWHKLLRLHLPEKSILILSQLMRYGMVGGMAFCSQFLTVLSLVHYLKLSPLVANTMGFGCGFIVSFLGHRFWTFRASTQKPHLLFINFLVLGLINLALNQSLYYFFLTDLHLHYATALPIVILIATSIVFCANKVFVFRV